MQKHLSALLLSSVATVCNAQLVEIQKPVQCGPTDKLFTELMKEYQEQLYWAGAGEKVGSNYVLWVNAETKTWTLTQSNKDVSCILGTGTGSRVFLGNTL